MQGLSLSGMDTVSIQNEAIATMKSKYPNCSLDYHMCVDTVGAISTASDRGGHSRVLIIRFLYRVRNFDQGITNIATENTYIFGNQTFWSLIDDQPFSVTLHCFYNFSNVVRVLIIIY